MEYFIIISIIVLTTFLLVGIKSNKSDSISNSKESLTTRQMMYVVTMSSLAIVVGVFEIPIGPTGLKFDFSEVVILITFLMLGFKGTSFVIILRSLVRFVLPAKTGAEAHFMIKLLGEVIAVVASFLILYSYILTNKLLKVKERPLLEDYDLEHEKPKVKTFVISAVLSALILTVGITIFHILFTMPIFTSIYANPDPNISKVHYFITTFLKDPNYSDSLVDIIRNIIIGFGLLNVVKGVLSPIIFLLIKPRIEKAVK